MFGVNADGAAHALDGFSDDGEPDASAFIHFVGVDSAKDFKDLLVVLRSDADAVIRKGNLERIV